MALYEIERISMISNMVAWYLSPCLDNVAGARVVELYMIKINHVTASSGTAISTDFATLTCSEILSKILFRCVTWH